MEYLPEDQLAKRELYLLMNNQVALQKTDRGYFE